VPDLEESIHVEAPAEVVWRLVSDLPRMGEWSPESTGGRWTGGASGPAPGARFRGSNRKGVRRWSTLSTIVTCDEPHEIAWDVTSGPLPVARWGYRIEPDCYAACAVTETWDDRRSGWFRTVTAIGLGVPDRAAHNRANMRTTLERLKAAAEASLSFP
jgi:hypothetical protein